MHQHEQEGRDPVEAEQRDLDVEQRQLNRGRAQQLLVGRGADGDRNVEAEQEEGDIEVADLGRGRIGRRLQLIDRGSIVGAGAPRYFCHLNPVLATGPIQS